MSKMKVSDAPDPKNRNRKKSQKKQQRVPVLAKEKQQMLFWYTVYKGNCNAVAKKLTQINKVKRTRKTVADIARKENFATKSHIIRDKVNKQFFGDDTPGMGRMMWLAENLLEFDEELLQDARKFMRGERGTRCESIKDCLDIVKHVNTQLSNLIGAKDFKNEAFDKLQEQEGATIELSVQEILDDLPEKERELVMGEVVDEQISKIFQYRGDNIKKGKAGDPNGITLLS